ncbi:HU family DNA-binding protein [Pseudoroseomonas oryzae]|uniref:HU family DNA-binding protein n=1 Tax=Teichococcus oryzae TaxID=1608942 RepID=A0A5B2TE29_9PROT|nr:HU family DNA-binding protein [Pseudoroseomonas oryzae]
MSQRRPARQHRAGRERVNKQDLVAVVAETGELSKAKAAEVLEAVFGAIGGSLKARQEVRLVGFGTFSTARRKAGKGRNPRTGEEIEIPASTTVRFKPGKTLRDGLD